MRNDSQIFETYFFTLAIERGFFSFFCKGLVKTFESVFKFCYNYCEKVCIKFRKEVFLMNTDETINKEELTLQNTPKAVNYLINEIAEMRVLLEHIESQIGLGVDKHRPINIEKACQILNQTKNGINKMVRSRTIPHYIQGNKVYFFEDELIKWVEKGRVATLQEKYTSKRNY